MFKKYILAERDTNKTIRGNVSITSKVNTSNDNNYSLVQLVNAMHLGQTNTINLKNFKNLKVKNPYPFSNPLQIKLIEWRLLKLIKQLSFQEISTFLQICKTNPREYLLTIQFSCSLINKILNICNYVNIITNQIINDELLQMNCKYHISRDNNSIIILGFPLQYKLNETLIEDIKKNFTNLCYIGNENVNLLANEKLSVLLKGNLYNPPNSMEDTTILDENTNDDKENDPTIEKYQTLEITLTRKQVSQIIGQKGQTIEWLRDITDCIIKIIPLQRCAYSNDYSNNAVDNVIQKIRVTGIAYDLKQLISLLEYRFKLSELQIEKIEN